MARKVKITKTEQLPVTHFSQLIWAMVTFWIANSIVLLLINAVYPMHVVLGTELISSFMAALYAGGLVALIAVSAIPIIEFTALQLKMKMSDMHWMLLYLIINVGAVWFVSRFAELIGLGIRFWWIAVVIGLIFDVVQGYLMKAVVSKR